MILKVADIRPLLTRARLDPASVMPELQPLAADDRWQTREVAATALVEIGKRHPEVVLHTSHAWAVSDDENVRRAAIEGLRGLARTDLRRVLPVLELLRADVSTYVKKAVANVLRDAGNKQPDAVLELCRGWARSNDRNTQWIVRAGLRKLHASRPADVAEIVSFARPDSGSTPRAARR